MLATAAGQQVILWFGFQVNNFPVKGHIHWSTAVSSGSSVDISIEMTAPNIPGTISE